MNKVGIVTIFNSNYGNRLQNYALQESLKKMGVDVETIRNVSLLNKKKNNFEYILRNIKYLFKKDDFNDGKDREKYFKEFNNNIEVSKFCFNWFNLKKIKKYDMFIVGSDQVWNPTIGRLTRYDLVTFSNKPKFSYAASFGISELSDEFYRKLVVENLRKYKKISVREEAGKQILTDLGLKSKVVLDPTMLLSDDEWRIVSKKPEQYSGKKYILNYFLGELAPEYKKIINDYAEKHNLEIINILDNKDKYYFTGPSEFLYLEEHAELICTDSFHSSVFSILFNRPFVVFDRNQKGFNNMNSRIDTLLDTFELKERKYKNGKKLDDYIEYDYTQSYDILNKKKKESMTFLEECMK